MELRAGSQLGPYEILGSIGAGGMGEVYRARDPRLGRDVAVKVLPGSALQELDRLRRFEQEAKAAGALNHPNVLAVYDVGAHDGAPFVVSELLEGETLRSRMGGSALPVRKALDYAAQAARGLAAAHEKGIVHRDLKPENLFVTKDGRVKILDFGLAKLAGMEGPALAPTESSAISLMETDTGTVPGTVLGTIGYMSPEQVQGHAADHRSDIFSFGAVLFEMLTGRRAFKAATAPETLTAILKDDPLQGSEVGPGLAPGLERVLRHCLEKSPEERFQSARDLAFALDALSGLSDGGGGARTQSARRLPRHLVPFASALLAVAALGVLAGKTLFKSPPLAFNQLTFRAGAVAAARFAPDGETIVYSAAWDGGPLELFTTRPEGRESRSLGLQRARILSISRAGEMALLLLAEGAPMGLSTNGTTGSPTGTLARLALAGGAPREVIEDTLSADWSPDGDELAVSRWSEDKCRLEYPIGRVLYESENPIPALRVSPDGRKVAFLETVAVAGSLANTWRLAVVDAARTKTELYTGWGTAGIAWSPSGRELWIDGLEEGGASNLLSVTLSGRSRLMTRLPGMATLSDVSHDGHILIVIDTGRHAIFAKTPGESKERNLSWHNDSTVTDLSADGQTLLFAETMTGGGPNFASYLRRTDGSPAVRLGAGFAYALSPDGKWALAFTPRGPRLELMLWPTRAGEPKHIAQGLPAEFHGAAWLPDSTSFVISGSAPGEGSRLFLQDVSAGTPRPFTDAEDDLRAPVISPDGRTVAAVDADGTIVLCLLDGRELHDLAGAEAGELPIRWSTDGRSLYTYRPDRVPIKVFAVDIANGQRRLAKEIALQDMTGVDGNLVVTLTPDARAYAYSFYRTISELFL